MTSPQLFIFGLGFSGQATARLALSLGWRVSGAVRTEEKAAVLAAQLPGLKVMSLERPDAASQLRVQISQATHLLASAPTVPADLETPEGPHLDPLLALLGEHGALEHLGWTGYLAPRSSMTIGRALGWTRIAKPAQPVFAAYDA